mgnify:CR=1 FL=1
MIAMATDDVIAKGAHAGNLIKAVASIVGGGGGGRPNMAQAGGKNPAGRSFCDESPVTITFEPNPILVRNIFICAGVVFCASSRMIKALSSVRPRIYASGATSISPFSIFAAKLSAPII